MLSKNLLFLVLWMVCLFASAPVTGLSANRVISGIVQDETSHEGLEFCNIMLFQTAEGTVTDTTGHFTISIPPDLQDPRLIISYTGYLSDTVLLSSGKDFYDILLSPDRKILNEIIVTGSPSSIDIHKDPVPVIAVSSRAINETSGSNIIDVLVKNIPGLNAVKTGPNISKPFIRGLGYNRVLTLYDGIRQEGQQWGDEHGLEVDSYNISRAEVIKGPSSLMYGSDALAGVISLIPYIPHQKDKIIHGQYLSEYQANNGLIGNGFRLTYSGQHWAYAIRGSYRIARNYRNAIDGRVYNTGFREKNLSLFVQNQYKKGYSNLNLTLYDDLQGIPDGSRDSLSRKFTEQIYEGAADDIKNRPVVPENILNSYQLSPLHQHIQHYRIYSKNHYMIGQGDIDILLAFQQNIRREYDHPTLPEQAGMFVRLNTFNYGIRYNAPRFMNIDFSLGVNGMFQDNLNKDATDFPIPDYSLFDAGTYLTALWKSGPWSAIGGIRYDIRQLNGNNFYTRTDPASGFQKQVLPSDTAGAYLQFPYFRKTFSGESWSLGITYKLNDHINAKANMARGYRAPNMTEFASNGLDPGAHIIYLGNRNFVPEFSVQEDIGIEMNYGDLSCSASAFNNNIDHYIYLSLLTGDNGIPVISPQGNKTYQYRQSSAQLYGLETQAEMTPGFITGLKFTNSLSLIYGYNRSPEFKDLGLQGEYLPMIPPFKWQSNISRDFHFSSRVIPQLTLNAGMDYNASQNRYLAIDQTESPTPGYTLFNAGMEARIFSGQKYNLQFQVRVNNIFDKAYQSNLSRLKYFEYYSQSPNGHLGIYNMGRNICFRAILAF